MIELDTTVPTMSANSDVAPTLRASAGILHLAYRRPPGAGGTDRCAVLRFDGVRDWHYGYPNDEALDAHPLHGHGLRPYEFHVTPVTRRGERAWIATFHDGTFTVFARAIVVVDDAHVAAPDAALVALFGNGPIHRLDGA